jgi:hypothetical protein
LPQSELAYIGFRLAVLDTFCQMEMCRGLDHADDGTVGYLGEIPFLEAVAPAVQVDLLADAWKRHTDAALQEASLLDAAVLYAAFKTAGRVIHDQLNLAWQWLRAGPRRLRRRPDRRTATRLTELFFSFWDDIDFLTIEQLQDLEPQRARAVRDFMRLGEGHFELMEQALNRWRASPEVLNNLKGLLTDEEMHDYARVVLPTGQGQ